MVMTMPPAEFPVLFAEREDPTGATLHAAADGVLMLVDEFSDIIDEFAAWDAECRPVLLRDLADRLRSGERGPAITVAPHSDTASVWKVVEECAKRDRWTATPAMGESPVEYFQRCSRGQNA